MSRPLFVPIICFLAGIFFAGTIKASPCTSVIITLLIFFFVGSLIFLRKTKLFYTFLCAFFLVLGIFRYTEQTTPRATDIVNFVTETPQKALLSGTVISDPERKGASYAKHLDFTMRAGKLLVEDNEFPVTGAVLVKLYAPARSPRRGDKVVIGGGISLPGGRTNPAGFDYRNYLNNTGIRVIMSSSAGDYYMKTGRAGGPVISLRRAIAAARKRSASALTRYLSGAPLAVTRAVILGQRGDISSGLSDIFMKTGTMHVLAVSGLHVGIVAAVILLLLRLLRCPRDISCVLAILGMFAFAVFAGCRPSSMRAAIMGSFVLFGLFLGRKTDILNSLAVSAFLITFYRPGQLFLPGFQLSYLAVLSIMYITPFTDSFLGVKPRHMGERPFETAKRYALRAVSVSMAAWAGMLPVIAFYFRIITPLAVVANLVAVPALSVMVTLGFFLLAAGSFAPLAKIVSTALSSTVFLFTAIMERLSSLPFSFTRISAPGILTIIAFYAALAAAIIFRKNTKKRALPVTFFLLVTANLFIWNEAVKTPPSSTRVTFFDAGKADASLVEFPDGSALLIDGGSGGMDTGMDAGRNILAPYLWQKGIRKIDCVVLTHAHADHIGGLFYILENFKTGYVIDGGSRCHPERAERVEGSSVNENPPSPSLRGAKRRRNLYRLPRPSHGSGLAMTEGDLYVRFLDLIANKNLPHLQVERGDLIKGFKDTDLFVLNPPGEDSYGDLNNDSVVMKMTAPTGASILFCADVEEKAINDILRFGTFLGCDVLKIPHHGQGLGDAAITRELIKVSDPAVAIIPNKSSAKLNKDLLEQLNKQGVTVYVTGVSGAVVVEGGGVSVVGDE